MGKSQKNIDDLFRNKLEHFEHTPDPALWNTIQKQLPKKKQKKVIPLWIWPTGIAASFILILVGYQYFDTKTGFNTTTVVNHNPNNEFCPEDTMTITTIERANTLKDTLQTESLLTNEKSSETLKRGVENSITHKKPKKALKTLLAVKKIETQNSDKGIFLGTSMERQENNLEAQKLNPSITGTGNNIKNEASTNYNPYNYAENKKSGFKRILKSKEEENKIDEKEFIVREIVGVNKPEKPELTQEDKEDSQEYSKKWSIQPQIAPLLYNSISGNSSIEATFENEVQTIDPGISYGLKIAYQITPKWSIRAGINTASVNIITRQVTSDPFLSGAISSVDFDDFGVVDSAPQEDFAPILEDNTPQQPPGFNPETQVPIPPTAFVPPTRQPTVIESPEVSEDLPLPVVPENNTTAEVIIRQQISYVEIPLEFSYQLVDKRLGASIIGGLSTFILSENTTEVLFDDLVERTITGTSENLNTTSFSGNFGIGFDYAVTETIQISVEPTVKFQFNAFEASTDFNPYIFGVYSGIKFRL